MTLRSPKKRLITAPTCNRAKRSSLKKRLLLSAALLIAASGVGADRILAQDGGWQDNRHFRPVPTAPAGTTSDASASARSSSFARRLSPTQPAAIAHSTQRSGWNLQWRTSPAVVAEQARRISDAAFDQPPTQRDAWNDADAATANIPAPGPVQRIASDEQLALNQLRNAEPSSVRQVAWLNQNTPATGGGFAIPDNLFRDSTATPEVVPPGRPSFGLPNDATAPAQELPMPRRAPEIPNELSDLFEIDPPTAQASPTTPNAPATPKDNSSIRGMIQDTPAPTPQRTPLPAAGNLADDLEPLGSPSDRDAFAPNPFGNRSEERAREREEREEERERRRDLDQDARPSIFSDDDGPASSGTGLSCDDFRTRIEESTIDQVSLDISPPFRPDVIDNKEYEKLRGKFSDKQQSRTWRSIDGRPLGTGRLEDLAYEKAIISTEFGTREELPLNRLSESDLAYISQNWGLPTECLIEQVAYTPRTWTPTTMTWAASNLCHKPLYFEEVNLERYGHTAGPFAQPVISSAHFFFNIAVLPYKMGVHSPHECQYALGYYRPGNCAPWIIPPVPLSVKGAWYQAAAITGGALLIP